MESLGDAAASTSEACEPQLRGLFHNDVAHCSRRAHTPLCSVRRCDGKTFWQFTTNKRRAKSPGSIHPVSQSGFLRELCGRDTGRERNGTLCFSHPSTDLGTDDQLRDNEETNRRRGETRGEKGTRAGSFFPHNTVSHPVMCGGCLFGDYCK